MFQSWKSNDCKDVLKKSGMFAHCSETNINYLSKLMTREEYHRGDVIYEQYGEQNSMAVIAVGKVQRCKEIRGQTHCLGNATPGHTLGGYHVLRDDKIGTTSRCLTDVVVYKLSKEDYMKALEQQPSFAEEVVYSMSREIRRQQNLLQTPLLEQRPKPTPYFCISVAAAVESFYRSALNATLNAKLTGQQAASFFPNMTVQVPARVVYINGFKGIRHILDNHVDPEDSEYETTVRLATAVTPGIIMTPVSSILEACNAGHMNPEPLQIRWMRGLIPRGMREVIFGIGLNQLSDYFEERISPNVSPFMKNVGGSLLAGVVAGYISHIPHNLSTLKLMNPQKTYGQHCMDLIKASEKRVPANLSPAMKMAAATALTLLSPKGLAIRTTQIVGSFVILNGTINSLKDFDPWMHTNDLAKRFGVRIA